MADTNVVPSECRLADDWRVALQEALAEALGSDADSYRWVDCASEDVFNAEDCAVVLVPEPDTRSLSFRGYAVGFVHGCIGSSIVRSVLSQVGVSASIKAIDVAGGILWVFDGFSSDEDKAWAEVNPPVVSPSA